MTIHQSKNNCRKESVTVLDNYMRHFICPSDTCFVKYCRSKDSAVIHRCYIVLRNEGKIKSKQSVKKYYEYLFRKKVDLSMETICSIGNTGRKLAISSATPENVNQHYFIIQQRQRWKLELPFQ